jgi:hypothetical protein
MLDDLELASLLEQFQDYLTPPYPPLKVPDYKTGKYGMWTLDQFDRGASSWLLHWSATRKAQLQTQEG